MLRICCLLTGDDYQMVKNDTPASKRKIILLATCLCVPVILWFINGALIVHQVLLGSLPIAIATGTITAFIVFLIERAVIMSNGSKWIALFRVLLGLIVALLGSFSFDEVIFKGDIDQQVAINKDRMIQESVENFRRINNSEREKIEKEATSRLQAWEEWQRKASDNAEGKNGVPYGYGEVAKMLERVTEEKKDDYNIAQSTLNGFRSSLKLKEETIKQQMADAFGQHSLLIRIKAMFDLVGKDTWMLFIYLLFTLLLFFLEFLVVIIKISSEETNYERKVKAIERIGFERIEKLTRKDFILFDPTRVHPMVKAAKAAIEAPSPAFFS